MEWNIPLRSRMKRKLRLKLSRYIGVVGAGRQMINGLSTRVSETNGPSHVTENHKYLPVRIKILKSNTLSSYIVLSLYSPIILRVI
jgi:hypothetical protein